MYILSLARKLLCVLVPLSIGITTYLYFYAIFHGCVFPAKDASRWSAFSDTFKQHLPLPQFSDTSYDSSRAPFRLLVLADPQLEGDSSLPSPEDAFVHKLKHQWQRMETRDGIALYPLLSEIVRQILLHDIPDTLQGVRKRIDLFGNDYFLGHIYRTLHWWTSPSHVTVLGDLIGSQWVTDEEFEWRGWRYWNRVFSNGQRLEDEITSLVGEKESHIFNMTDSDWSTQIINIAGNHDIGYAGEVSERRMNRFERVFGKADWDVRFRHPGPEKGFNDAASLTPSLHLVVLNSLVLDGPALSGELQSKSYDFLNGLISNRLRPVEDRSTFTLLLTHLPLYKRKGICVDGPHFDYWGNDDGGGVYTPNGVKEQNHLSEHVSHKGTLEALFGMSGNLDAPAQGKGRNGLILNGHDHDGCDTWHFVPETSIYSSVSDGAEQPTTKWEASHWQHANVSASHTGIREITLRSMMGDYGGNAGLLSAWFDYERGEWQYDIQMCGLSVKVWWAVHIIDLVCLGLLLYLLVCRLLQSKLNRPKTPGQPSTTPKLAIKGK